MSVYRRFQSAEEKFIAVSKWLCKLDFRYPTGNTIQVHVAYIRDSMFPLSSMYSSSKNSLNEMILTSSCFSLYFRLEHGMCKHGFVASK